jgi:hypothetical protein
MILREFGGRAHDGPALLHQRKVRNSILGIVGLRIERAAKGRKGT